MTSFPADLSQSLIRMAQSLGISPQDVDESFVRGSGAGGQKINKTSSCVLLRYRPTGMEVRCQAHREQSRNRLSAWKLLILKIEREKRGKESAIERKLFKIRKQKLRRSRRAKEKMLEAKHRRSTIKEGRRGVVG